MVDNDAGAVLHELSSRNERLTEVGLSTLKRLLPTLDIETIRSDFSKTIEDWCALLSDKTLDPDRVLDIGAGLPYIDVLQPDDVLSLQSALLEILLEDLPEHLPVAVMIRLQKALSAFLAGMFIAKRRRGAKTDVAAIGKLSHDLKNPINSINGFSWVILKGIDGPITEYQREDLTSIHEAGKKLLDMINDIFAGLKQNALNTYIHEEPFHVWGFLSDVLQALEPAMTNRKQWLQLVMAGDPGLMKADASTLRIILLNLLSFYARRMPESTLSILSMRQKIDANDWLVFRLEHHPQGELMVSTGGDWAMGLPSKPLGMSADEGESTLHEKWVNTDIALTAAYQLCKEMGANLTMNGLSEDQPCKSFTLWVPAGINQTDVF